MENKNPSHESTNKPLILRESEFYGGCIRVKISVRNTSSLVITGVALELESDEKILHFDRCEPEYPQKKALIALRSLYLEMTQKISRGSLLSFCDLNGMCGGNVVIEDSLVNGTNIASWMQEDKEKTRIEEQKKLEEARKQEKQREADLLRKVQDAQREKERQVRQSEEAARMQQETVEFAPQDRTGVGSASSSQNLWR